MNIKFSTDLLNLIHLLQSYKRFLRDQHYYYRGDPQHDIDQDVFAYFEELPLPIGVKHNRAWFNAIISYPTDMLNRLDLLEDYTLGKIEFGV